MEEVKKNVTVFSGSKEGFGAYNKLAEELGKELAKNKFVTVNGGGPGLMDLVAKGAYKNGGEVIGVHFELEGRKPSQYNTQTLTYVDLHPRQQKVIELADAFVVLPGGIGTVFELFEVLAKKHLNEMDPNIPVFLLPGDFWYGFLELTKKQVAEGFMADEYLEQAVVCNSIDDVILKLEQKLYGRNDKETT